MTNLLNNPFTPTFGHVPTSLVGRDEFIDDVIGGLANAPGDPNRSTIFVGPRGSGKTVLMRTISKNAEEQGWISVNTFAHEGMLDTIEAQLRANASHVLQPQPKSNITSAQVGPVAVTREMKPVASTWSTRLTELIQELNEQGVGVLLAIDEVDPNCTDLVNLISEYQLFISDGRDVALLLAGLPSWVSALLTDNSVSFVRRAFQRTLGPVSTFDAEHALYETFAANGKGISAEALRMAAEATGGFPYAIQLMGYYLWRDGREEDVISAATAQEAIRLTLYEMERSVYLPTLNELRPREVDYLHAMAKDEGLSNTSEVARRMGISMTNASNLRRRLVVAGVIREVHMGVVDFELPLLRDYLRR